jgi:hypothetical protein
MAKQVDISPSLPVSLLFTPFVRSLFRESGHIVPEIPFANRVLFCRKLHTAPFPGVVGSGALMDHHGRRKGSGCRWRIAPPWEQKRHPGTQKAGGGLLLSLMNASGALLALLMQRARCGALPGVFPSITAHCRASGEHGMDMGSGPMHA